MSSEPALNIFIDGQSMVDISVIALVVEDEFELAQAVISEWSEYSTFEEWRASREGYQMGLAMAGVEVRMIPIALTAFLTWCRNSKTLSSACALETFAARSCDLWPKQRKTLRSVQQVARR
jgi:hypothetical protein